MRTLDLLGHEAETISIKSSLQLLLPYAFTAYSHCYCFLTTDYEYSGWQQYREQFLALQVTLRLKQRFIFLVCKKIQTKSSPILKVMSWLISFSWQMILVLYHHNWRFQFYRGIALRRKYLITLYISIVNRISWIWLNRIFCIVWRFLLRIWSWSVFAFADVNDDEWWLADMYEMFSVLDCKIATRKNEEEHRPGRGSG